MINLFRRLLLDEAKNFLNDVCTPTSIFTESWDNKEKKKNWCPGYYDLSY